MSAYEGIKLLNYPLQHKQLAKLKQKISITLKVYKNRTRSNHVIKSHLGHNQTNFLHVYKCYKLN
jgi:hypothetical protein